MSFYLGLGFHCALPLPILALADSVVKIPCLHLRQQRQFLYLSKQQISHIRYRGFIYLFVCLFEV